MGQALPCRDRQVCAIIASDNDESLAGRAATSGRKTNKNSQEGETGA